MHDQLSSIKLLFWFQFKKSYTYFWYFGSKNIVLLFLMFVKDAKIGLDFFYNVKQNKKKTFCISWNHHLNYSYYLLVFPSHPKIMKYFPLKKYKNMAWYSYINTTIKQQVLSGGWHFWCPFWVDKIIDFVNVWVLS